MNTIKNKFRKKIILVIFLGGIFHETSQAMRMRGSQEKFQNKDTNVINQLHIHPENLEKVFEKDQHYWTKEKKENLQLYFNSPVFKDLKSTRFSQKTINELNKEKLDKINCFITY